MTTEETFKELQDTFGDEYTCTKVIRDDGTIAIECTRNERNTDKQSEVLTET
jgi:hypothetical protein